MPGDWLWRQRGSVGHLVVGWAILLDRLHNRWGPCSKRWETVLSKVLKYEAFLFSAISFPTCHDVFLFAI